MKSFKFKVLPTLVAKVGGKWVKNQENWVNWGEEAPRWEALCDSSKFPDDASVRLTHSHSSLQTVMMTDLIHSVL